MTQEAKYQSPFWAQLLNGYWREKMRLIIQSTSRIRKVDVVPGTQTILPSEVERSGKVTTASPRGNDD